MKEKFALLNKPDQEYALVFDLFEGTCPDHPGIPVTVKSVAGHQTFIRENIDLALSATDPVHIWPHYFDNIDGEVEFTCLDGCHHVVSHNIYGDWNL